MLNKGEGSVMPQLDVGFHGKRKKKKKKQQSKQPQKFVEGSSILRLNFD